jgi:hypothetical protein
VALLQILTADERDFPFDASHRFRDPETGEELLGDGAAIRADYPQLRRRTYRIAVAAAGQRDRRAHQAGSTSRWTSHCRRCSAVGADA